MYMDCVEEHGYQNATFMFLNNGKFIRNGMKFSYFHYYYAAAAAYAYRRSYYLPLIWLSNNRPFFV